MTTYGTFYGRETTLWQGNAYLIYATDQGLYFARISDKIYGEEQLKLMGNFLLFGVAGIAMKQSIKKKISKQKEIEAKYDNMDLSSPEFAGTDSRNFSILSDANIELNLVKAGGMSKSVTSLGFIEFQENGKKRRFTLTGETSAAQVYESVNKSFPTVKGNLA